MKTMIALIAFAYITIVFGYPTHNGMFFYQTPTYYNSPERHPYHRAMFVHYNEPSYPAYPSYRSNSAGSGSSVFAAGDTIAAGTYLRGSVQTERPNPIPSVPVYDKPVSHSDDDGIHALAEAYPQYSEEAAFVANDGQKVYIDQTNDAVLSQTTDEPEQSEVQNDNIHSDNEAGLAPLEYVTTEEPARPTTTPSVKVIIPKNKKVTVALAPAPHPKAVRDDDEEEDDDVPFFYKPQKRKNSNQTPYSFFPLNFGDTSGGAIAVANAFSTGKGGASSHAIAYGTPSSKKGYSKRLAQQKI